MNINLTITASNPDELAEMLRGLVATLPGVAQEPAPESNQPKRETRKTSTKTETTTAAPETPAKPEDDTPPWEEPKKATVSLEVVRAKLADLVRAGKQEQVKSIFPKFGATKLSEVPEDRLSDLLAEAEAIA